MKKYVVGSTRHPFFKAAIATCIALLQAAPIASAADGDWLLHGRDAGEQRFSPLKSIDTSNVARLGLAWQADLDSTRGLEGTPIVERLNPMHIGKDVELQLKNDLTGEMEACKVYNAAIKECEQYSDNGSRELLESILKDEEAHVDWLEAQLDQVSQMGIQIYLSQQKS